MKIGISYVIFFALLNSSSEEWLFSSVKSLYGFISVQMVCYCSSSWSDLCWGLQFLEKESFFLRFFFILSLMTTAFRVLRIRQILIWEIEEWMKIDSNLYQVSDHPWRSISKCLYYEMYKTEISITTISTLQKAISSDDVTVIFN